MKKYFPLEEDELMPLVSSVGLEEKSLGLFLQIRTVQPKEVCNREHGLSAAIELGSLEKTVGASLIALWAHCGGSHH